MNIGIWCKELLWRDKIKNIVQQIGATPVRVSDPLDLPQDINIDIFAIALADLYVHTDGKVPSINTTAPLFGFFPHVEEHLEAFGEKLGCAKISTRGAIERNLGKFIFELSERKTENG